MEKAKPLDLECSPPILNLIGPPRRDLHPLFTDAELDVAEQLVHLSESSGPSASANSLPSASSSTRSVSAPAPAPQDDVPDDEVLWRRNRRYRSIADLYASTVPITGGGRGKKNNRKGRGSNGGKVERV